MDSFISKHTKQICLILVIIFSLESVVPAVWAVTNGRPIIGIVAQEIKQGDNSRSYIAASYVKAVEAAGARAVPIFINKTLPYYREIMGYINGVILPGGSSVFGIPGGFSEAVINVYNIAKEINDRGDGAFPILGVCQGMEILAFIAANYTSPLVSCECNNMNMPLKFKPKSSHSRLYRHLSEDIHSILSGKPVTSNHHEWCLTEENMKKFNLDGEWRALSTNEDVNGLRFVSSVESRKYPFAGVQFHPEKPAYEWNPVQHNPHNYLAIYVNRYFYDWLINISKFNNHQFTDRTLEKQRLIYNYPVTYTPEAYDLEYYLFHDKPV